MGNLKRLSLLFYKSKIYKHTSNHSHQSEKELLLIRLQNFRVTNNIVLFVVFVPDVQAFAAICLGFQCAHIKIIKRTKKYIFELKVV